MTIAGLVAHLTEVEQHWMVRSFLGQPDDTEQTSWADPALSLETLLDAYAAQRERSRRITAMHDLDELEQFAPDGLPLVSLRWILGYLIEETARHLGHLDIVRELTHGARGR